jgi:hypothetical protein
MGNDYANLRKQYFADNLLAWTSLRHFLSARMVRELSSAVVDQISGGKLSMSQLFDDVVTFGPDWLDSWMLQPRGVHAPLEKFLQSHIRAIAWQNDAETYVPEKTGGLPENVDPKALENALRLGTVDLSWPEQQLSDLRVSSQNSYAILVDVIALSARILRSSTCSDFLAAIMPPLKTIEGPLAPIMAKHLGDLCADADAWDKALALYNAAEIQLSREAGPIWRELTSSLQSVITQSRASAIWTLTGASATADLLSKALAASPITEVSLLAANASFDELVASMQASEMLTIRDQRAALLLPPLLQNTHDPSSAIQAWLKGDFRDSHRHFWAVLRRQIALGMATESRITKALYARSVLDGIVADLARGRQPDFFRMAISLLIQSGDSVAVTRILWNEQLIDAYVNEGCVRFAIAHSEEHLGARSERQRVVIELFHQWIGLIGLDRTQLAVMMLRHVVALATNASTSLSSRDNLGGRSLEVIRQIAQRRPELRSHIASEVAAAIINRFSSPSFWTAKATAFEIAEEYGEVFSEDQLKSVAVTALDLLATMDPKADAWPILRPALTFLVSTPVKQFSALAPEIGERIVDTILRLGVERQHEHALTIFYLHDFDSSLLRDKSVADKLQDVLAQLRQASLQSNSSNAVADIQALLLASTISGRDGVRDALTGLANILKSVSTSRCSIALPEAYASLLLLANQQKRIADDLSLDLEEFRSWLTQLSPLVANLWIHAKDRPRLLAQFSLPPATVPNPVIVHNWAFASMVFAESLEEDNQIFAALEGALAEPMLQNSIALARATRSTGESSIAVDPEEIRKESRDIFYSALGRRLVVLQRLDGERGRATCDALLEQCFRHGPRDLDAAVFLSAARFDICASILQTDLSDYVKRMGNNRDLRLALLPLLEMFGVRTSRSSAQS